MKRVSGLTPEELSDLILVGQRVGGIVEKHYGAASLTIAIQVCMRVCMSLFV